MAKQVDLAEKARRRRRYELRIGAVHLRGGRRQNVKHKGRGRPAPTWNKHKETHE